MYKRKIPQVMFTIKSLDAQEGRDEKRRLQSTKKTAVWSTVNVDRRLDCSFLPGRQFSWLTSTRLQFSQSTWTTALFYWSTSMAHNLIKYQTSAKLL